MGRTWKFMPCLFVGVIVATVTWFKYCLAIELKKLFAKVFFLSDPETIAEMSHQEEKTVQVLRQLGKINVGRHGMEQVSQHDDVIK